MQNPADNTHTALVLEVPVLYVGGKKDGCLDKAVYTKNDDSKHAKGIND
jgi:hypothetical protein